ncbi:hypothetical protein L210DRAFT_3503443 [Boletus edulis BED1]|uniref:Uncharacterized protein n=1 Tax=Boletus edulis BED1 TaxID=1328754 RepID=A0AAD4BVR4_BOLED|nr:hypothetical protein L210DRAFT_3503443 [Boletus edulis BED1]
MARRGKWREGKRRGKVRRWADAAPRTGRTTYDAVDSGGKESGEERADAAPRTGRTTYDVVDSGGKGKRAERKTQLQERAGRRARRCQRWPEEERAPRTGRTTCAMSSTVGAKGEGRGKHPEKPCEGFPIGYPRWVRWWGGWAENENRDTLIRYLLDELHTYETDYSDALAPARVQRHANDSLMGEAALIQPVSVEDVRSMMDSFGANFSDLRTHIVHVNGTVHELKDTVTVLSSRVPLSGTTTTNAPHPMDPGSHASSDTRARLTIKIPPRSTAAPTIHHASGVGTGRTRIASSSAPVTRPQPTATTVARTLPSLPSAVQPHFESVQSSDSSSLSSQPGHAQVRLLPTPGLVIPDIPVRNPDGSRRPKSESWRDIVKHWTEGDPALGLHTPLKDWPPEWTRGSNRLFAAKHQQRSLIALEFTERFQSDEAMFLAAYPEAAHGHCALLRAINATRQARGECEVRSWPGLRQLQDS